uniref:DsrE/DsrF-like family protein n=1 Tax=Minutocellus polymorphus TaxID=265543 RepID=A0A7S0AE53_9STRA|mmetsp:Transcript_11615/g.19287  ORF Transcript_11615/g.19287 Transcript_11615/m.19287 type:complete len:212 (+) Transcript_11615:85-720(+)
MNIFSHSAALYYVFLLAMIGAQNPATIFADAQSTGGDPSEGSKCPSSLKLNQEFGTDTKKNTRCLANTSGVKLLVHIQRHCVIGGGADKENSECTESHALNVVVNAMKDYEETGMKRGKDYHIAVVLNSNGAIFGLDPDVDDANENANENHSATTVRDLLDEGVSIYLCQNTARFKNIMMHQLIDGIQFVTAGVTAIGDLQMEGYSLYTAL